SASARLAWCGRNMPFHPTGCGCLASWISQPASTDADFMPTARLCRHQPSKLLTPRIDAKPSVSPQIAFGIILWSLRWHQSQETEDINGGTNCFAGETDSR